MNEVANQILKNLGMTANLLKNAAEGEAEKRVEVSFVKQDGSITIDAEKFMDEKD